MIRFVKTIHTLMIVVILLRYNIKAVHPNYEKGG